MDINVDIYRLVAEYAEGIISHNDFEVLCSYAKSSIAHRDEVRRDLDLILSSSIIHDNTPFDKESAFLRLENHISAIKSKWVLRRILIAAIFALLIAITPTLLINHRQSQQMKQLVVLSVPDGSKLNFTLPDGTQITLNSASRLVYTRGYGITDRTISMVGEGYIQVKHNDDLPFIINTQQLQVTDLGTKFTFRDYPDESSINVNLEEGKLSLHNNMNKSKDCILTAGDKVIIDKETGKITFNKNQTSSGCVSDLEKIVFDDMPLSQIAFQLQKYYGVKVSVTPNASGRRYHGTFDRRTYSITDVLESLASTESLKYKRTKNGYLIY